VVACLQVFEQVENLCLDGDIEGRDDLVAYQQPGFEHECTGDADALALAPENSGVPVAGDVGSIPTESSMALTLARRSSSVPIFQMVSGSATMSATRRRD